MGERGRRQGLVIYGATGFTGRRIATEAATRWRTRARQSASALWLAPPLLSGRSAERLEPLASSLGLPFVVAPMEDRASLDDALMQRGIVINAAGPYAATAEPIAKACLRTRTHYLDLSGETASFRRVDDLNVDATQLGVMLLPGAGFVVTASDYLTARLVRAMPRLRTLRVALSSVGSLSRGTLMSLVESARTGATVRRAGRLVSVPMGQLERKFVFDDADQGTPVLCTAVAFPDLITAPLTARTVANVETYAEASSWRRLWFQASGLGATTLQLLPVKRLIRERIGRLPESISMAAGAAHAQVFVAEGEDHYGALRLRIRLHTDDAYAFSAWSALLLAEMTAGRVAANAPGLAGLHTPSGLFHDDLHDAISTCSHVQVSTIREEGLGARHDA